MCPDDLGEGSDLVGGEFPHLAADLDLGQAEVEVLVLHAGVHVVLHEVLDGGAEVGVDTVVLVHDGRVQVGVVSLHVHHGHLRRTERYDNQYKGTEKGDQLYGNNITIFSLVT